MTVPSDTKAAAGRHIPQTLHVAIYEHPHVLDLATGETVAWTYTDGWLAQVLDGGDPDE